MGRGMGSGMGMGRGMGAGMGRGMGMGKGGNPFARLFANLIIMASGMMGRAFLQAYQQALKNGPAAAEAVSKKAPRRAGGLAEPEARQILNLTPKCGEAEVNEAFERLTATSQWRA